MSKTIRGLILSSGAVIFGAWGFRLMTLLRHWKSDVSRWPHLLTLVVWMGIGAFLLHVGRRGDQASRRDYTGVVCSATAMLAFWGYRWMTLIMAPEGMDTRERAHLHLSSLFLVLGILLFVVGWHKRRTAH